MAADRSVISPLDYNKTLKYQADFLKNIDKAGVDYRVIMALDIANLVGDVSALSSVSYNALVDQFEALADYADNRQLFEQEIAEMPKTKGYRTVIRTTKWLTANMGNAELPADEMEKRLLVLREHFTAMRADPAKINELLDGIRKEVGKDEKDREYTGLKLNNELVSILSAGKDGVLRETGWTNARFAHALGFRHGTANAFVLTPEGKLLLQRRIPHRAQELKFSILGGHLSRGERFEAGIRKELLEELSLLDRQSGLQGRLELIGTEGQFVNEDPQNREYRSLYVYTMTPDEYAYFKKKVVDTLNNERRKGDGEDFERWLIEQNKMKKGFGEVWNYLEIEPSALQAMIAAGKNALDYTEEYRTGPEDQLGVEFTADLFLPLLQGEALQRPGIAPVNPLDELEAVLRVHHTGAASPVVVTPFLTPFIGTKGLLSGRVIWEQVLNIVAPSDRRPVARKLFPALTGVNYVMDSPDRERAKELAATGLKVSVIMPLPGNADVGGHG
jgi:ADP-ribose pyrophosphatase YjhB (NUDIX family)